MLVHALDLSEPEEECFCAGLSAGARLTRSRAINAAVVTSDIIFARLLTWLLQMLRPPGVLMFDALQH